MYHFRDYANARSYDEWLIVETRWRLLVKSKTIFKNPQTCPPHMIDAILDLCETCPQPEIARHVHLTDAQAERVATFGYHKHQCSVNPKVYAHVKKPQPVYFYYVTDETKAKWASDPNLTYLAKEVSQYQWFMPHGHARRNLLVNPSLLFRDFLTVYRSGDVITDWTWDEIQALSGNARDFISIQDGLPDQVYAMIDFCEARLHHSYVPFFAKWFGRAIDTSFITSDGSRSPSFTKPEIKAWLDSHRKP